MEHFWKIWLFIRIFALCFSANTADLSVVRTCNDISGIHMINTVMQKIKQNKQTKEKARNTTHKSAVLWCVPKVLTRAVLFYFLQVSGH